MAPPERKRQRDFATAHFFLIAVAYKVPWTAISSLLGQFRVQYQEPRVLLYLNLAYFFPSMPALLIHSSMQDRLERSLGVPRAALLRFVVGLGGLALLCLALPLMCSSLHLLLVATAAVGICYSVAFGTSYQLVARFPPECTVSLTTGFVSCGVVVLVADLLLKRGPYYTPTGMSRMFEMMAVQTCIGLLAATAVLRHHWRRLAAAGPGSKLVSSAHCPESEDCRQSSSSCDDNSSGGSGGGKHTSGVPVARLGGRVVGGGGLGGGLGMRHAAGAAAAAASIAPVHQQQLDGGSMGHQQALSCAPLHQDSSINDWPSGSASSTTAVSISFDGSSHATHALQQHQHQQDMGPPAAAAAAAVTANSTHSRCPQPRHGESQLVSRLRWLLRRAAARAAASVTPLHLLLRLGLLVWPAWVGLLLSVGSSMLAFPFFTFTPHNGALGEHLPQVLFYSRLLGDILGRLVPPAFQLSSSRGVLLTGCFKAGLLLVLLPALLEPRIVGGDIPLAVLVAANWWLSGYVNCGAYLLAPKLVAAAASSDGGSSSSRSWLNGAAGSSGRLTFGSIDGKGSTGLSTSSTSSLKAKAGGLMAFCFQVSCFLGLMGAAAIQAIFLSGWTLPATPSAAAAAAALAVGSSSAAAATVGSGIASAAGGLSAGLSGDAPVAAGMHAVFGAAVAAAGAGGSTPGTGQGSLHPA